MEVNPGSCTGELGHRATCPCTPQLRVVRLSELASSSARNARSRAQPGGGNGGTEWGNTSANPAPQTWSAWSKEIAGGCRETHSLLADSPGRWCQGPTSPSGMPRGLKGQSRCWDAAHGCSRPHGKRPCFLYPSQPESPELGESRPGRCWAEGGRQAGGPDPSLLENNEPSPA